jgi:hypothetical protein
MSDNEPECTRDDDCMCKECVEEREAEKDRQFDEQVAMGYWRKF